MKFVDPCAQRIVSKKNESMCYCVRISGKLHANWLASSMFGLLKVTWILCDPITLWCSIIRFLSDMAEALDWVKQIAFENKWKTLKVRVGPGIYFMVGCHPEVSQVVLKSGGYLQCCN